MSDKLFRQAQSFIAGGVNSPVRAFAAVGGDPVFIDSANGPHLYSADGRRLIDYVGSWGPMILGHAHPAVIRAVQETAAKGLSFGAPTELETRLAEKICKMMPSIERLRMVSSGTEATMSAIRLARGFTRRDKIVKFEGCYHGHADSLLVKAGSGALTFGVPTSPGVPADTAAHTLTLPFNDSQAVESMFKKMGDEIACIIVEPIAGNMNMIKPVADFLPTLREQCTRYGAILIFDEVMTGFRVAAGGAQALYDIRPDLTTLGKIVGGGLPVGAFGGKAEIMAELAPEGPVYQAGTLSGNPLGMAAGLATLNELSSDGFYENLESITSGLASGLEQAAVEAEIDFHTSSAGGMFGMFFSATRPVSSFDQVLKCDQDRFVSFFTSMLKSGIYLAPSSFEAGFVSAAHGNDEIDTTIEAASKAFRQLANG